MPVEFKIKITKEIIERSKYCGVKNNKKEINRNCAVAFALKDIFPNVYVTNHFIFPLGIYNDKVQDIEIPMPIIAQQFIKLFDGFSVTPELRLLLPEFEFTINIPDEIIDGINIDDMKQFLKTITKEKSSLVQF